MAATRRRIVQPKGEAANEATKQIDPPKVLMRREVLRDGDRRVDVELVQHADGERVLRVGGRGGSAPIVATVAIPRSALDGLARAIADARAMP